MKNFALIFLAICGAAIAANASTHFGLTGQITITEAGVWSDGGSVTITLEDEHGNKAGVWYQNTWLSAPAEHPGQMSLRIGENKPTWLSKNGREERALLSLIRIASIAMFGTADTDELRKAAGASKQGPGPPEIRDMVDSSVDQKRFALSSFFRQFADRDKKNEAKKSE